MSNFDLLVLAPEGYAAAEGEPHVFDTPYGAVGARLLPLGSQRAAWAASDESPFAALYAAKAAGAARVVELAPAAARNRLLAGGDLLLPDDLIDRTRLPRYTFFAGKGYGFLSQREPFCPVLRGALLAAASEQVGAGAGTRRVFARGVYLAAEQPGVVDREPIWEADLAGAGVVPASFLARELELCYAPLCVVEARTPGASPVDTAGENGLLLARVLAAALARLPAERACACATAMQQYRDRGDIGADWRTWIAV